MPLQRILEPEVMDSAIEAEDYDSMDHTVVNNLFVNDLIACGVTEGDFLDLGTGTAQIPIELCRRTSALRVMAADAAIAMLELARYNVEVASLIDQIQLAHVDAKKLPYPDRSFSVVMSNSIVHHIPEPLDVLREAVRVVQPGGLLFFRDLMRPADDDSVQRLVDEYAKDGNPHQRQMFDDSLRAALDLNEIRSLVVRLGFSADTVQATSDRHWTWKAWTRDER